MNKSQSNYFNMAKVVLDVFDNSKPAWENRALLSAAYTRLKTLCSDIDMLAAFTMCGVEVRGRNKREKVLVLDCQICIDTLLTIQNTHY